MTVLSLLICHNPIQSWRKDTLRHLLNNLAQQCHGIEDAVQIEVDSAVGGTIGGKRNRLLDMALGSHLAFIDDDDNVAQNYVELVLEGISNGVDCCSLTGIINEKGKESFFLHALRFRTWYTGEDGKYYRYPNHLNCIRSNIAKQFMFPEFNHGEDRKWSDDLHNSGLLRTEHWIEQPIYFYEPSSNRR